MVCVVNVFDSLELGSRLDTWPYPGHCYFTVHWGATTNIGRLESEYRLKQVSAIGGEERLRFFWHACLNILN